MIKLIIFDVGGVIINYSEEMYLHYISKKLKMHWMDLWHVMEPLIERMELDELDVRTMEGEFARGLGMKSGGKLEWVSAFRKLAKPNKKVIDMVNRLVESKKYDVVILSDISKSRWREADALVLNKVKVKRRFASCYIKMRKQDRDPKKRPYRYVLREMHAKPQSALFIDNMPSNIEGAKEVGINGIVFKNAAQLKSDLKKFGVYI
jgi:HAD superfamily hydrolase (TIGR01509 family)